MTALLLNVVPVCCFVYLNHLRSNGSDGIPTNWVPLNSIPETRAEFRTTFFVKLGHLRVVVLMSFNSTVTNLTRTNSSTVFHLTTCLLHCLRT